MTLEALLEQDLIKEDWLYNIKEYNGTEIREECIFKCVSNKLDQYYCEDIVIVSNSAGDVGLSGSWELMQVYEGAYVDVRVLGHISGFPELFL